MVRRAFQATPATPAQVERESLRLTLDALNLARAHLAGWSGGGLALIEFAIEYPERVRSLALVEPAAYWILTQLGERLDEVEQSNGFVLFGREVSETSWQPSSASAASPDRARTCGHTPTGTLGRAPGHAVVAGPAPGSPEAFDRRARTYCGAGPGYQGDELAAQRQQLGGSGAGANSLHSRGDNRDLAPPAAGSCSLVAGYHSLAIL